ncbi:MAG: hypothetical protein KAY37_06325 [Phycisphaerae bacterium]|nr:hypothetical protein [Phycisphaerae bacterium]
MPAKERTSALSPRTAAARPSARFWTSLVILVLAAVGVRVLPHLFGVHFRKEAVPLKLDLQQFDVRRLAPNYLRHRVNDEAHPISEDLIDSLGTREYLQVYLTDARKPATGQPKTKTDPTKVAQFFVTYYTGRPDMVPHVPDECYLAGGYDPLGSTTKLVHVPGIGAPNDEIPVRVVRFRAPLNRRTGESDEVAVLYFFHVNGGYATTRDGVRVKLSNPFQRFAYYAKIEVTFTDDKIARTAGMDQSLAALGPLLEAVMPVLLEDHFDLGKFVPVPAGDGPVQQ